MSNERAMNHPHDHIMANTWRLIFEGAQQSAAPDAPPQSATDFSALEQLLPEYRLIGLCLADDQPQRRPN